MNHIASFNPEYYRQSVRHWVETLVVDLNLCPFAKRELVRDRICFAVCEASSEEALLEQLHQELLLLEQDDEVETTLLIHPLVLQDFSDYNDFLNLAEGLLIQMGLEGVYQIASFHPDYQFAGTEPDDVENYTNRTPYPLMHLIREESLERAIANYPDPDNIPQRNIELVESMGEQKLKDMLQACLHKGVSRD